MLGGVFISYRREDSGGFAGRIYDRLTGRLGRDAVFFDVDNIPAGLDFVDVLSDRVGKCDALVAVIGKTWNPVKDNRPRLDDPGDFVRVEIEAALNRGVRVIPVLVDGAAMPRTEDLPDSLKKLTRRQGIEISHTRFDSDVERLTEALSEIEDELRANEGAKGEPAGKAAAAKDELSRPDAPAAAPARSAKPRRLLLVTLAIAALVLAGAAALIVQQFGARHGSPANAPSPAQSNAAVPAVAPAANAASASDGWLPGDEFKSEFKKQWAAGLYPDMMSGRCEDGVVQFHAHWAQRPPGLRFWYQFGVTEDKLNEKNS